MSTAERLHQRPKITIQDLEQFYPKVNASEAELAQMGYDRMVSFYQLFGEHFCQYNNFYQFPGDGPRELSEFLEAIRTANTTQQTEFFHTISYHQFRNTVLEKRFQGSSEGQSEERIWRLFNEETNHLNEALAVISAGFIMPPYIPDRILLMHTKEKEETLMWLRSAANYVRSAVVGGAGDPVLEFLMYNQHLENHAVPFEVYVKARKLILALERHLQAGGDLKSLPESIEQAVFQFTRNQSKELKPSPIQYGYSSTSLQRSASGSGSTEKSYRLKELEQRVTLDMVINGNEEEWLWMKSEMEPMLGERIESPQKLKHLILSRRRFELNWPEKNDRFLNGVKATLDAGARWLDHKPNPGLAALQIALLYQYRGIKHRRSMNGPVENATPFQPDVFRNLQGNWTEAEWFARRILAKQYDWGSNYELMQEMKDAAERCELVPIWGVNRLRWIHGLVHEYASERQPEYLRLFRDYIETGDFTALQKRSDWFPIQYSAEQLSQSARKELSESSIFLNDLDKLIDLASRYYDSGSVERSLCFELEAYRAIPELNVLYDALSEDETEANRMRLLANGVGFIRKEIQKRESPISRASLIRMLMLSERCGKNISTRWKETIHEIDYANSEKLQAEAEMMDAITSFACSLGDAPETIRPVRPTPTHRITSRVREVRLAMSRHQKGLLEQFMPDLEYLVELLPFRSQKAAHQFLYNSVLPTWLKQSVMYDMEHAFEDLIEHEELTPGIDAKRAVDWVVHGTGYTLEIGESTLVLPPRPPGGFAPGECKVTIDGQTTSEVRDVLRSLFPDLPQAVFGYLHS